MVRNDGNRLIYMAFIEKKRKGITPRLLTANGNANGLITVSSVSNLFVKQKIVLSSNTKPKLNLEIKRFVSPTQFYVGQPGDIKQRADLSAYLVADGASISADEQDRPGITDKDYNRAAYMEEPVVAHRVVPVDENGEMYGANNPMPVSIDGDITIAGDVIVDIDAIDDFVTPDNALAVGTEDGTKTGVRHVHKIDSDGDLHVKDETAIAAIDAVTDSVDAGNAILQQIEDNTDGLETAIGDTNTKLDSANTILQQIEDNTDGLETAVANVETAVSAVRSSVDTGNAILQQIEDNTDGLETKLDDIVSAINDQNPIKISGTENGQAGGVERVFVNNLRLQIIAAKDRIQNITYQDFGTKNQRITRVSYTAPSIGSGAGFTANKNIYYTLVGNFYRRDTIEWELV